MFRILQGFILGLAIVLPGLGGGTAFLLLGLYEKTLHDFSRLRFLPYLPLLIGTAAGIFAGGFFLTILFSSCREIAITFLLGSLWASIRVLFPTRPQLNGLMLATAIFGFLLGFFLANDPLRVSGVTETINWSILLLGGVLSSSALLIPGISGSLILVVLGIYDDMLFYLKKMALLPLLVFGVGSLAGLSLLANLLEIIFTRYRWPIRFFFAGLIAGSSRSLFPSYWSISIIVALCSGFILVWWWSSWKQR